MPFEDYLEKAVHGTKEKPFAHLDFDIEHDSVYYPDKFFVDRHWHPKIEILYIEKGEYLLEYNLNEIPLKAGDICFINSQQLHMLTGLYKCTHHHAFLFPAEILSFEYMDDAQSQIILPILARNIHFPVHISQKCEAYDKIQPMITELIQLGNPQKATDYMRIKAILMNMLCELFDGQLLSEAAPEQAREQKKVERLKTVFTYMDRNYGQKVTLQQLADELNTNKEHFCRFFRQITGRTPFEYLQHVRVNKACEALLYSDKKLLEIALDCGFGSEGYFIHTFKKLKGQTPGDFRKKNSGGLSC